MRKHARKAIIRHGQLLDLFDPAHLDHGFFYVFFMFFFGPDPFGGPSTRNRLTRIKGNLKMLGIRKAHFGSLALNCKTQILSFDLADFKNSPDLDDITLKFISNDQLPTSPPTKKNRKSSI